MKAALIQLDSAWEDQEENLSVMATFAARAAAEGCDTIIFPEMATTGFSMDLSYHARQDAGALTLRLSNLARLHAIMIIAGVAIKTPTEKKGRNMALVFNSKGQLVSAYTKMHPFSCAGENRHFIAGKNPSLFQVSDAQAAVFICYDLRFPELFRSVARQVQAIFIIANWPTARIDHWETLLKARAIENQCFVVGVNRTGTDGTGIVYGGTSLVYDALGRNLCRGNETDSFIIAEFDLSEIEGVRHQFPFLEDMDRDKEKS